MHNSIRKLSKICIALFCVCLSLKEAQSEYHCNGFNVDIPIKKSDKIKNMYILRDIQLEKNGKILKIDRNFYSIIRIEDKKYCQKDQCLTFFVINCNKAFCPYTSSFSGKNFVESDHLTPRYDRQEFSHSIYECGLTGKIVILNSDFASILTYKTK